MPTKDGKPSITRAGARGMIRLAALGDIWLNDHHSEMSERDRESLKSAIGFAKKNHHWKNEQRAEGARPE